MRFQTPNFDLAFQALTNSPPIWGFEHKRKGYSQFNLMINHAHDQEPKRYIFLLLDETSGKELKKRYKGAAENATELEGLQRRSLETGIPHLDLGCNTECTNAHGRRCIDRLVYTCCSMHAGEFPEECKLKPKAEDLWYCTKGEGKGPTKSSALSTALLNKTLEHAMGFADQRASKKWCGFIFKQLDLASAKTLSDELLLPALATCDHTPRPVEKAGNKRPQSKTVGKSNTVITGKPVSQNTHGK